jgi:xanthine/CO dehydrogenase XdhC/CoxF family maturation factor
MAGSSRVHAPIRLEIGAETLEEIAVSSVGQIMAVMRGKA